MKGKKRILFAVLDWGLGHATRSVPVIRQLQEEGHEVILSSAGTAKNFLVDYFPELKVIEKPAYDISYPQNGNMSLAMLRQSFSIAGTIFREHSWLKKKIKEYDINTVYSDNCYGLWNKHVHSVFITHQLNIAVSKNISPAGSLVNPLIAFIISRYNECLIPDYEGQQNYSGKLSHVKKMPDNARFIKPKSRFKGNAITTDSEIFDIVILLSGPEPQRTLLEDKCFNLLKGQQKRICMIRGLPGSDDQKNNSEEFTWHNHLSDNILKATLQHAKKVVCRPGYSTIMDLAELNVKALLIPTPGQTEQEYLAEYNEGEQFSYVSQEKLTKEILLMTEQATTGGEKLLLSI